MIWNLVEHSNYWVTGYIQDKHWKSTCRRVKLLWSTSEVLSCSKITTLCNKMDSSMGAISPEFNTCKRKGREECACTFSPLLTQGCYPNPNLFHTWTLPLAKGWYPNLTLTLHPNPLHTSTLPSLLSWLKGGGRCSTPSILWPQWSQNTGSSQRTESTLVSIATGITIQ